MPTDFDNLEQTLETALSSAQNHAIAASGTQGSGETLAADLALLVSEIDALRKDVERTEKSFVLRDQQAASSIHAYAGGIAAVTEDVASSGALAQTVNQQLKDAFTTAAGSTPSEADLRQAVIDYDTATDELTDDAVTELNTRLALLTTKEETVAQKGAALDAIEVRIHEMADLARHARLDARAAKERFDAALAAGEHADAIVHLQDFLSTRDRLDGTVQLPPDDPQFDADAPAAATTALTSAWETARDEYHTALSERFEAHLAVLEQRIAIAELEGDARLREARRLVDVSAAVQALLP